MIAYEFILSFSLVLVMHVRGHHFSHKRSNFLINNVLFLCIIFWSCISHTLLVIVSPPPPKSWEIEDYSVVGFVLKITRCTSFLPLYSNTLTFIRFALSTVFNYNHISNFIHVLLSDLSNLSLPS